MPGTLPEPLLIRVSNSKNSQITGMCTVRVVLRVRLLTATQSTDLKQDHQDASGGR